MEGKIDLNHWYQQMLLGPSTKVETEFFTELWAFCRKAVRKFFPGKKFYLYEDCVAIAVEEVMKSMATKDSMKNAAFTTWVTGVVKNVCKDAITEHEERQENRLVLIDKLDVKAPEGISLVDKLTLRKLIEQLPQNEQDLVNLKLQGFENKEVGEHFGISEDAAKKRYQRITEKLSLLARK